MCKSLSIHHMCCIFQQLVTHISSSSNKIRKSNSKHKQLGTLQSASNYSLLSHIITKHTIIAISEINIVTANVLTLSYDQL